MADYRILHEDPSYERIRGERRARSFGFFATIAGWLAIISFCLGFLSQKAEPLLIFLGSFAAWVVLKLVAKFLFTKYKE